MTSRIPRVRLAVALLLLLAPFGVALLHSAWLIGYKLSNTTIPPQMTAAVERINRELPPDEPLFYICQEQEFWFSRMWQRAFFPRPVFLVMGQRELEEARFFALRHKYGIRFAISSGAPPLEPGFRSRVTLYEHLPNLQTAWWGELR